jgi:hypothetical protein
LVGRAAGLSGDVVDFSGRADGCVVGLSDGVDDLSGRVVGLSGEFVGLSGFAVG